MFLRYDDGGYDDAEEYTSRGRFHVVVGFVDARRYGHPRDRLHHRPGDPQAAQPVER